MKIILASASPRRKELMNMITSDFSVICSDVDETVPDYILPEEAPRFLADLKASAVAAEHPDAIVIGCDTSVFSQGEMLGKPADAKDAARMLRMLSNSEHKVITGCCICRGDKKVFFDRATKVRFFALTEREIQEYIATGEPLDKAGAYGIQGKGSLLVSEIEGDYFNVVGLPVSLLKRELDKFIADI